MSKSSNHVLVSYAPVLTVRFVGELFYMVQILAIWTGMTNRAWIANQDRKLERTLIDLCSSRFTYAICRTFRAWWSLRNFTIPIILDVPRQFSPDVSPPTFEGIMWTFVYCSGITRESVPTMKKFFPDSYHLFPVVSKQ